MFAYAKLSESNKYFDEVGFSRYAAIFISKLRLFDVIPICFNNI